ncbi:Elongation factor 1-beta 1-like protein [Drosera capensis]
MAAAVIFSDLHTEPGLKSLDSHLADKPYISGSWTKDDIKVFVAVEGNPGDGFVNARIGASNVNSEVLSWMPAPGIYVEDAHAGGDDNDDLDLFGDETEEENKAAEEREAAKKPTKKKESGKSSVLLDVKQWDDETDMKKLEETVRSI